MKIYEFPAPSGIRSPDRPARNQVVEPTALSWPHYCPILTETGMCQYLFSQWDYPIIKFRGSRPSVLHFLGAEMQRDEAKLIGVILYLALRRQTAVRTASFRGYVTQFSPVAAWNPIALYRTAQILKSHFATSSNYNESSSHLCWHKQLCIIFIYRVTALFAEGVNITHPTPP